GGRLAARDQSGPAPAKTAWQIANAPHPAHHPPPRASPKTRAAEAIGPARPLRASIHCSTTRNRIADGARGEPCRESDVGADVMAKNKIAIVGAGAVGGYAGAHMVQAGEDVTYIDPWPENVEAIRKDGLRITHIRDVEPFTVKPRA